MIAYMYFLLVLGFKCLLNRISITLLIASEPQTQKYFLNFSLYYCYNVTNFRFYNKSDGIYHTPTFVFF